MEKRDHVTVWALRCTKEAQAHELEMARLKSTDKATPQAPEAQDMPRETGETSEGPT